MAAKESDADRRPSRLVYLLVAVIMALVLSILGAYMVVVSQNPAGAVSGPAFVYGSPTP
jgi:hypothetical protein